MKTTKLLREGMKGPRTVVSIGAYDAFSALLVERAGFRFGIRGQLRYRSRISGEAGPGPDEQNGAPSGSAATSPRP